MIKALKHFFGLRKLKSIIALTICFILWQGIRLIFPRLEVIPIYAFFYSIIEMRKTIEHSKITAISRIKVTVIGFFVAFLSIGIENSLMNFEFISKYISICEFILILIGVLIAINIADAMDCGTLCAFAATTFIICFLHTEYNPYFYSFLRFIQTLMGVGVALIVNIFIFKPASE